MRQGIVSGIFFVVSFFVLFASYAAILHVGFNIPSNNDLNSALLFFSVQTLSLSCCRSFTILMRSSLLMDLRLIPSDGMATAATRYGEPRTISVQWNYQRKHCLQKKEEMLLKPMSYMQLIYLMFMASLMDNNMYFNGTWSNVQS